MKSTYMERAPLRAVVLRIGSIFLAGGATLDLRWIGILVAIGYWALESTMHAYVFDRIPLLWALVCEGDVNELSMRATIVVLLGVFGFVSEGAVRLERRGRERATEMLELSGLLGRASRDAGLAANIPTQSGSPSRDGLELESDEAIGLAREITSYSREVESRFREFRSVLELTREINVGYRVDEVLNRAYEVMRPAVPYDRIGVALIDDDCRYVSSIWARSDHQCKSVPVGYRAPLRGSSLEHIVESGQSRIINDLCDYLKAHPQSESTRRIVADGIRSSLTCPLYFGGRPVGFIFFSSKKSNTYTDRHRDVFGLVAGHLSAVIDKARIYEQLLEEKRCSESLLLNVMPARIAQRLSSGEEPIADLLPHIGILFADLVGFTEFASEAAPAEVVNLLRDLFVCFDKLCDRHRIEKIKTIGDAYMAVSGTPDSGGTGELASLALDMCSAVSEMRTSSGHPIDIRVGIHAGPAVAGVIGQKKFSYDVWGDSVNVASRLESTSEPGFIHVSEALRAELDADFQFEARGEIQIKGRGPLSTFFLIGQRQQG